MTEAEERRYYRGRYDWREGRWQDHCGDPNCKHCDGMLDQHDNPYVAAVRQAMPRWIVPE